MKQLSSQIIDEFVKAFPGTKQNVEMSRHTFLKIGGFASLFLAEENDEVLINAVRFARVNNIPMYVLGGGSNLLIADAGFEGLILQSTNRSINVNKDRITASAGAITAMVARKSVDAGLEGFEWGIGVPGTIGGAVFGNAGCFGGEMKDVVESVSTYFMERDHVETCSVSSQDDETKGGGSCAFGYRNSRFKHEPCFILSATLHLQKGDQEESQKKMNDIISARKKTQPQGTFSAGCLFKNFEVNGTEFSPQIQIPPDFMQSRAIPAGWLIDTCGLKGTRVGDAEVSTVHANFIINRGNATAENIHELFLLIQKSVQEKTGIKLENEVQFLF
ncbi:MAG: UDP-N-acetylmuramate dehydrogenase [bacterium]|nr:UDP-N-acetylmuramate dehydrogenase [bacterium]